jgi:drug/metabolite transporter (DMT)-like permease
MSRTSQAFISSILASVLWGGNFPAMKVALQGIGPLDLVLYRSVLAALFTILVFPKRREMLRIRRKEFPFVLSLCLTGGSVFWIMAVLGVKYSTPINASFLVNTNPLFIVIFASLFLQESVSGIRAIGMAISIFGAYVIVSGGQLLNVFASETLLGDAFALIAAILWATYTITYKRRVLRDSSITAEQLNAQMFVLSVPILFVVGILGSDPLSVTRASLNVQIGAVYVGLIGTGFAYFLFNRALKTLKTSASAMNLFVTPVSAMLFSYIIVNEPITLYKLAGGALILIGILMPNYGKRVFRRESKRIIQENPQ